MNKPKITIEEYNPTWKDQFEELKTVYTSYLKEHIKSIEHVGSTSVPGLAAKPVLDIDIIIAHEKDLQQVIPILENLGYNFRGDLGIKDRYAFSQITPLTPHAGINKTWPKHHLYCCTENSGSLNNHLTLRDTLRNNPDLKNEYSRLKKELAMNTDDMNTYIEGKNDFIGRILLQNGFSETSLKDIARQNTKKE